MLQKPLIMLDFETTGLSPEYGARILEVAALRMVGNKIEDRFVSLVNCNVSVPTEITQLTGITQRMADSAPDVTKVVPELLKFIGTDALAAHNAAFDAKFLQAEAARLRKSPGYEHLICSVKLTRRVFPGLASYNLSALARQFAIQFKGTAHRAEADAEVTAELVFKINEHLQNKFDLSRIEPELLVEINKISIAKVPSFLQKWNAAQAAIAN